MTREIFTYDNVYLRPRYSELSSRDQADTSIDFLGHKFKLPVVPANMQDVISWQIARSMDMNGYFYIMHRFEDANSNIPIAIRFAGEHISISIGVNGEAKKEFKKLWNEEESFVKNDLKFLTIDIAHAHHKHIEDMMSFLREMYSGGYKMPKIIAGNVATAEGYKYLCGLGVDAVKVGVGGGSICTTKNQTGFHLPTAYSVWECAQCNMDIPIIADGGAKHYGDIAKALILGADLVMSGGWFASCLDSPAKIVGGKKVYRGSTSYEAKRSRKHIEGKTLELDEGITYAERLDEIQQALASSISYAGGKDLSCFNNVEWHLL